MVTAFSIPKASAMFVAKQGLEEYSIKVIDELTGKTVDNLHVVIFDEGGRPVFSSTTASGGMVQTDLEPGSYMIRLYITLFGFKWNIKSVPVELHEPSVLYVYVTAHIIPVKYLQPLVHGLVAGTVLLTALRLVLRSVRKPRLERGLPELPAEEYSVREDVDIAMREEQPREALEMEEPPEMHELGEAPPEPEEAKFVNFTFKDVTNPRDHRVLPLNEGFRSEYRYKLTVWMGMSPDIRFSGPMRGAVPSPVKHPVEEAVDLYVTVFSLNESKLRVVGKALDTLKWPLQGPSADNAEFILEVARTDAQTSAGLDVFIYYKTNLLYSARIRVVIQPMDYEWPLQYDELPIKWWETEAEKALEDQIIPHFASLNDMSERGLNIAVQPSPERDEYLLTAFIGRAKYPARVEMKTEEITKKLVKIRGFLDDLRRESCYLEGGYDWRGRYIGDFLGGEGSFNVYREPIEAGAARDVFDKFRERMAQYGSDLYYDLFKEESGELLRKIIEDNVREGDIIQIWLDRNSSDFMYPWAWLYSEKLEPSETVEVENHKFWGYRYIIELVPQFKETLIDVPPIEIRYDQLDIKIGVWNFEHSTELQRRFFTNCRDRSGGSVRYEIWDDDDEWEDWLKRCDSHIIYFFSHGHTAVPKTEVGLKTVDLLTKMKEWVENSIPGEGAEVKRKKKELEKMLKELEDQDLMGRTFIKLNDGYLFLKDLRGMDLRGSQPLVFLNMCESAQVYPTISEGLIEVFLKNGARGVIGTEIPMIDQFADLFSRQFFEAMFYQKDADRKPVFVGKALLDLRRRYIDMGNPLGFAYTYFGNARTRLEESVPS